MVITLFSYKTRRTIPRDSSCVVVKKLQDVRRFIDRTGEVLIVLSGFFFTLRNKV